METRNHSDTTLTTGASIDVDALRSSRLEFMSFASNKELLRATALADVLRNGASILSSSVGTSKTYALSCCVPEIDVFLSHNWVIGRGRKFVALSLLYNTTLAAVVSLAVQLILLVLTAKGYFPIVWVPWDPDYPRGVACKVVGIPIFILMVLMGGDIRSQFGYRGQRMFLDKTCINQEDKEIQMQGIKKLGAFLSHSNSMVVLYSDVYLTKLWTVYEVACFLSLHPVSKMVLVPITLHMCIFTGLLVLSVLITAATFIEAHFGFLYSQELAFLILGPLLAHVLRQNARQREALHDRVAAFSVAKCSCAVEDDRKIVYHNIAELMRAAGVVGISASEETSLDAFDHIVRAKLSKLVAYAMGRRGFKYRHILTLSISTFGPYWLDTTVGLSHGMPWPRACSDMLSRWSLTLAVVPVSYLVLVEVTRSWLDLRGLREKVIVCAAGWAGTLYAGVWWAALRLLWKRSEFPETGKVDLFSVLAVGLAGMSWILAIFFFFGCRRNKRTRRRDSLMETNLSRLGTGGDSDDDLLPAEPYASDKPQESCVLRESAPPADLGQPGSDATIVGNRDDSPDHHQKNKGKDDTGDGRGADSRDNPPTSPRLTSSTLAPEVEGNNPGSCWLSCQQHCT